MRGHHFECHPRGAGTDATGAVRGHQRSRNSANGGGAAEESGQAHPRRNGLPVSIADDPLASVVLGTGKMLSDFRLLRQVCID